MGTFSRTVTRLSLLTAFISAGPLACDSGGGSGSGGSSGPAALETSTMLRGRVVDLDGNPVEGVTVILNSEIMSTNASGRYALETQPATSAVVRYEKPGYMPMTRKTAIVDGHPTVLDVSLRPLATPVLLDASSGGEATGMRGAMIVAPAGAFVDTFGAPVQGMIDVHLTAIDPTKEAELIAAPELIATDEGGDAVLLESFGMLDVTLTQNDSPVQVADGMLVEIRIPAPEGVANPPSEMPLWHFDTDAGEWREEGTLTYDADEKVYVGQVGHFSTWNADQPASATCITGNAVDEHGRPLAGGRVSARGVDYSGMSNATTDDEGRFYIAVRKSSDVSVLVSHREGGGEARVVTSGDADTSVPPTPGDEDCLEVGTWTVERDVYRGADGVSVACDDQGNPLAGTCVESFFSDFSQCFQANGECVVSSGGGTIRYASGARIETDYSLDGGQLSQYTARYYGPGGQLCATGRSVGDITGDDYTFEIQPTGGAAFRMTTDLDTDDTTITCPNGESVTLDSAEQERLDACTGGEGEQECTYEGDSGAGGAGGGGSSGVCMNNGECSNGQICCVLSDDAQGYGICFDAGLCAQIQAGQ